MDAYASALGLDDTPAPLRNNNPGALMPKGKLATFATPEAGWDALDSNLQDYGKKGVNTLSGVISKWAPPNENNTQAYISDASKWLGVDPNQPIDLTDPTVRRYVGMALARHENGAGSIFKGQPAQSTPANDPYADALGLTGNASPLAIPDQPKKKVEPYSEMDAQSAMGGAILHYGSAAGASIIGGLHGLGKLATGGSVDDAVNTIQTDQKRFTFTPDGDAGDLVKAGDSKYSPLTYPAQAGNFAGSQIVEHGGSPALAAAVDTGLQVGLPMAAGKALSVAGKAGPVPPRVASTLDAPTTPGATPAAAQAAPGVANNPSPTLPSLANATPELQQAVRDSIAAGKPVDPAILQKHVEADTLPVPVKMTQGQALGDPELISQEMNGRGKAQPLVSPEFYHQQGKALAANVDAIKSKVAPDIGDVDKVSLGQSLIDAYKQKDAPVVADIDAKYQALRDAAGGEFPVDAGALLNNIRGALKKKLLTNEAPSSQMAEIQRMADEGSMSFEDFLSLRRNLGNISRTSADGNVRTAAGVMIDQLERLPLQPEAAALKPLADEARSAAKDRFDAMRSDPAYKAAVEDGTPAGEPSPLADKFTDSYVIRAPFANVQRMRSNFASDPMAQQIMGAATIEHLRGLGKVNPDTGNFTQAGWNNGLKALGPKLDVTLGDSAEVARQMGRVAERVQAQPRGSYVNNSNTLVGDRKSVV